MEPRALQASIPNSILPFPEGLLDRTKYVFWKVITPFYSTVQGWLVQLNILHHEGRQNHVIGRLAPGVSLAEFLKYLHSQGFGNHFIAWKDDDQVVSLRKLESFKWQYHLRVFNDGEVRGHYEYTPESHPKWHLQEVRMEHRREDFLRFLGDWVVPIEY